MSCVRKNSQAPRRPFCQNLQGDFLSGRKKTDPHSCLSLSGHRVRAEGAADGKAKSEAAAFAGLALGQDVAAVLAEDFSADRQAQTGSLGSFGADKRL